MGPMQRMNRLISSMFQGRGPATCSSSTASPGIGTCEKSYRRLLVNTWIGAIGMKGRKALAPSTLNMFPKLELAPILMYLMMFAKTFRPSITRGPPYPGRSSCAPRRHQPERGGPNQLRSTGARDFGGGGGSQHGRSERRRGARL